MTTLTERLIYTDLQSNHNKFWHANVDGCTMTVTFGRVGDTGQTRTYSYGSPEDAEHRFELDTRAKLRKGYTRQQTVVDGLVRTSIVAQVQIKHDNNQETRALIDFLVKRNIHKIEGTTSIKLESGRLTTPLGVVTMEGLDQAEKLLARMWQYDAQFDEYVNAYMRIVPRNIGRKRVDPLALFGTKSQLEAEQATLDSLRAVVKDLDQKIESAAPTVFETKLEIVDASAETYYRIKRFYETGINRRHTSSHMHLHRVWEMRIESSVRQFEQQLGNVKELWHGTRDANLLSILKNGFIIPRRNSGIAITGRMFGDGIYFSDQSTKALNYASGYWGGGASERAFMLLNDVAMGRSYTPRSGIRSIPAGYDSCFAKAVVSGVLNNEMVVYRTSQIKPKFLAEFR